jgi:CheY-like chemotaxis protein
MTKTVLDVGNCNPDHSSLTTMLSTHYDVRVLRSHELKDTLETVAKEKVDLILINRKLDIDYTDGLEILRYLKQDEALKAIPAMIVTNYPEAQQEAVAEGAEYGFGKLQYKEAATHDRLGKFLEKRSA